jgi:hypothetical protein
MAKAIGSIISVFVLFVAVAVAFQVGVAVSGQVIDSVAPGAAPQMSGPLGWGLALLMPFMFIALVAGLMRAFFGGVHRREGRWIDHRRTMLEEWHRQAHGEPVRADRPTA